MVEPHSKTTFFVKNRFFIKRYIFVAESTAVWDDYDIVFQDGDVLRGKEGATRSFYSPKLALFEFFPSIHFQAELRVLRCVFLFFLRRSSPHLPKNFEIKQCILREVR